MNTMLLATVYVHTASKSNIPHDNTYISVVIIDTSALSRDSRYSGTAQGPYLETGGRLRRNRKVSARSKATSISLRESL